MKQLKSIKNMIRIDALLSSVFQGNMNYCPKSEDGVRGFCLFCLFYLPRPQALLEAQSRTQMVMKKKMNMNINMNYSMLIF